MTVLLWLALWCMVEMPAVLCRPPEKGQECIDGATAFMRHNTTMLYSIFSSFWLGRWHHRILSAAPAAAHGWLRRPMRACLVARWWWHLQRRVSGPLHIPVKLLAIGHTIHHAWCGWTGANRRRIAAEAVVQLAVCAEVVLVCGQDVVRVRLNVCAWPSPARHPVQHT
jgi:hypothetical protein